MSRRTLSPARGRLPLESAAPQAGPDERDLIIKKLKQQLIIARSKEKEVVILENYLLQLKQKIRGLTEDLRRKQIDVKSKVDASQKTINDLKREIEIYKGELKNKSIELGEKQASLLEMKRHLAKRSTQLQKIKKESLFLKDQNDRLMQENSNYTIRLDDIQSELLRIEATNKNYESRVSEINGKIGQAKAYIGELNNEARILKDKLKKHEQENNNISDDLNAKQDNIDDLEKIFAEEHDQIKSQIDLFIELEHKNERILTEIRHKLNLNKAQTDKTNQLTGAIQKVDKTIANVARENQVIQEQVKKYIEANDQYRKYNEQLTRDLAKCQAHLQNLIKYNAYIQEQLEKYLREDEKIIAVLKRKRAVDLVPMRESRKVTDRTYI